VNINLKNVVFDIPREAAGAILQVLSQLACDDDPAPTSVAITPYLNDVVIDAETVIGDLVADDATLGPHSLSNGSGVCTDVEGPALNPDEWAWIVDQQQWTLGADPGPNTVYGVFLQITGGGFGPILLGAIRFDEPVPMAVDDILKVTGQLVLRPQITPVLP